MKPAATPWLSPERRRWVILGVVFAAMVLNYVDRQIVSVLKPTLKTEFGLDDRGYASLINVFVFCYASCYAGAGWLVDRFGSGRIMFYGMLVWSSACLGGAFAKTFGQLAFFRLSSPADHPYGSATHGSHYQGQRGPTASRSFQNFHRADV